MKIGIITKKMFALVFAFILTLTVIPVSSIIATTADFTITIEADKTNVQVGDEVTVSVNIPANTNLCTYNFALTYDNTKLITDDSKCTTPLKIGTAMASANNTTGQVNVAEMGAFSQDVVTLTQAGTILQVTFEVIDGASGNVEFGIKSNAKFKKPDPNNEDLTVGLTYDVQNNTNVFVDVPLTSISLSKTTLEVNEGETSEAIDVTYLPSNTTATDVEKTINWTSDDETIATVVDGKVKGIKAGNTIVTATTGNGKKAYCQVSVKAPISGITLSLTTLEVNEGETSEAIDVTYLPLNTTDEKKVDWTSDDETIATVENGIVTGVKAGNTIITATTVNGKKAYCQVSVKAPLTGIVLNKSQTSIELNNDDILEVSYNPSNTTDSKEVTWTSSDATKVKVEKINENTAKITGIAVTQRNTPVTITARVGRYEKNCKVSVTVPVTSVAINEQNVKLERKITNKETSTLTATIDPIGALENSDVEWVSANNNIATVTKIDATSAKVTAVADGTVEITATIGGKSAKTLVTVVTPVQSISLNKSTDSVKTGENVTLYVNYNPSDVTESLKGITWESSDTSKATVENGIVTTLNPTEIGLPVIITARSNSNNTALATCEVTILPIPLEGVQIVEDDVSLEKGTTKTLTGKCLPENTTDSKDLKWTSNNSAVATVNENTGKVTAIGPGNAVITATSRKDGTLSDTCRVTVTVKLTGIRLNETHVTLKRGVIGQDTITLVASPEPSDTTDNSTIIWSTGNSNIATVDQNGKVTAVGKGTTQIKVEKNGFMAICNVTVEVPLQSISLNKISTEILIKQSETLVVEYNPNDTSDSKDIIWTSSDESIATVDNSGKVTAKAEGTTTITAKSVVDNSIKAQCTVTTRRIALNSIALSESTAEMLKGKNLKLSVICNPDNTTDDRDVTWRSSDESIAIVDENGNVTALKAGNVTITATSNSNDTLTATCDIEVKEVHVESISIDKDNFDNIKMMVGKSFKLAFKLNPENATDNMNIVWTSSDPSIATIDNEGNVTALKEGYVKFTAFITTEYGETFEDTYEIYIKPEEVESLSPETGDANIALLVAGMLISLGTIIFVNKKRKSIKE